MKIFSDMSVYEAAKERLRFLFDEFEDIYVAVSGGKDSTVALYMTLEVAKERGRPIGIFFLDQEFEWQGTIDIMRKWAKLDGVTPYWLQCPLRMYNSNSALVPYVEIWDEKRRDKWMREKEPYSIQVPFSVNTRFHTTMNSFTDWRQEVTGKKTCLIGGLRAEESFNRYRAVTSGVTYKGLTWGRKNAKTYCFYPFYDWTFRDVWKYINDNGIEYNAVYDEMYKLGVPVNDMRISNLIHEYTTALLYLQEIEPRTYDRLTVVLPGISTRTKFEDDWIPKKLPDVFTSWKEYRDYLVETIVAPEYRDSFKKTWAKQADNEDVYRLHCIECIKSDVTHTVNADRTAILSSKIKRAERKKKNDNQGKAD